MTIAVDLSGAATVSDLISTVNSADISGPLDSLVETAGEGVTSLTSGMTDICNLSGTLSGMLGNAANDVFKSIKGAVNDVVSDLKSTVGDVVNQVQSAVGDVTKSIGALVKSVKETFDKAKAALSDFVSSIKGASEGLFAQIKSLIEGTISELNGMISSVTSVVSNAVSAVTGAITNIAKDILSSIKSLNIFSCSGAKNAVLESPSIDVLSKAKSVVSSENVSGAISSAFGDMGSKMKSNLSNLTDNVPLLPSPSTYSVSLESKLTELKGLF